ncbi:MAG: aspartate carbamoyltransferase catalytic subunit [Gammaproteobacteria bacterium]
MDAQQRRPDRSLQHLLTLDGLNSQELTNLLDCAERFAASQTLATDDATSLAGMSIVNLFFEPSTRTRISFELAARKLGANVMNLDLASSSHKKGESLEDTVTTLAAMRINALVVRHSETGIPAKVAASCGDNVSVINAGESKVSHPTQGLLDLLTIRRHKPDFNKLVIAIVGDVVHSRVAASAIQGMQTLRFGEIRLVGPESFLPGTDSFANLPRFTDMQKGLTDCDVIMMLRIQLERMQTTESPNPDDYFRNYGLSRDRLATAKSDAIVMHPGPMNRGVEIESAVADGPRSVIREQVANGVATRMAVLHALLAGKGHLENA